MAARMGDVLAEKLICFRRILHNTVVDSNIMAELYTEDNMSVIRELTSCLQITENRMRLLPTDVSTIVDVAAEFIGNICRDESDLCCEDYAVAHHTIQRSVEILTEYLRLLRNACADCPCHQSVIQTHKRFVSDLARGVTLYVSSIIVSDHSTDALQVLKAAGPVVWRCTIQFACNAVNSHEENAALFWDEFCPAVRLVLGTAEADVSLQQYSCCLLYQCLLTDPHHYIQRLVHGVDGGPPLMSTILSYLVDCDCEWGLYLCEKLLAADSSLVILWSHLSSFHKLYLLELVLSGLQRISSSMQQLNGDLPVSVDNMSFIADEFVVAADMLPTLLVHSDDSEKLERDVSLHLLRCLCEATVHRYTYFQLHDNTALLSSTLSVLKSLHLIAGLSDETLNLMPKAASFTTAEGGVYNVKSELMRLLANLVYRHPANQHMVRDLDGIALVLDHTSVDANNPYIVQWSVLAVRNLCEDNDANQRYIADMHLCGPTSRTVDLLSDIGVKLTG